MKESDRDDGGSLAEIPNTLDRSTTLELARGQEPEQSDDQQRPPGLAGVPNLTWTETLPLDHQGSSSKSEKTVVKEAFENKLAICSIMIPLSILGTLIRIGLQRLETYPGAPVFGLVYAQWIGCLIMGIVVESKAHILGWYFPLHVGLSTGLCGSITTFSSWQLDIFKAFSNYDAYDHNNGYNILSAISQLLVTLAMSFNGLVFGYHVGRWFKTLVKEPVALEVVPRGYKVDRMSMIDWVIFVFGVACWIGVILAAIFAPSSRDIAFACVFAPLGALMRWHLSIFNTTVLQGRFMFGTFAANMIGTSVLAALALVETGVASTPIACNIISGLANGFCGCLTTISTFVVELSNLPIRRSYIYGLSSIVLGQCFMFLVLGTFIWTQGVHPTCSSS